MSASSDRKGMGSAGITVALEGSERDEKKRTPTVSQAPKDVVIQTLKHLKKFTKTPMPRHPSEAIMIFPKDLASLKEMKELKQYWSEFRNSMNPYDEYKSVCRMSDAVQSSLSSCNKSIKQDLIEFQKNINKRKESIERYSEFYVACRNLPITMEDCVKKWLNSNTVDELLIALYEMNDAADKFKLEYFQDHIKEFRNFVFDKIKCETLNEFNQIEISTNSYLDHIERLHRVNELIKLILKTETGKSESDEYLKLQAQIQEQVQNYTKHIVNKIQLSIEHRTVDLPSACKTLAQLIKLQVTDTFKDSLNKMKEGLEKEAAKRGVKDDKMEVYHNLEEHSIPITRERR